MELMQLRDEEAELTRRLGDVSISDPAAVDGAAAAGANGQPASPPDADGQSADGGDSEDGNFDADVAGARLNEVYERMQEIGSHTAEARASKILYGLGELPTSTSASHTCASDAMPWDACAEIVTCQSEA